MEQKKKKLWKNLTDAFSAAYWIWRGLFILAFAFRVEKIFWLDPENLQCHDCTRYLGRSLDSQCECGEGKLTCRKGHLEG